MFTKVLFALPLVTGCHGPDTKKAGTPPAPSPSSITLMIKPIGEADSQDPQPAPAAMVRLVIFMLDMPPGSVSNNPDFWKRADEQSIGPANADRLFRNGVRCGIVPQSESAFFSQFFDHEPHTLSTTHVDALHTETFPLAMEKQFDRQDLFFFNASDELEGRSYDHGSDHLMLSFGPTPRDPGAVRLTLCPMVRSERLRMDFTPLNQEFESPVKEEEHLYDLALSADIPEGSFLIIAPSGDAERSTSVGGCFLTKSDKTEKKEQVIVPTLLRMDGKPMLVRQALIK